MSIRAAVIASFTVAGLLACEEATTPTDPLWGKQACASCTMLVSDRRFASQIATREGARVYFDDPGCMASWIKEHPAQARYEWVRSAAGTWIDARSARYSRGERSPMGYGFAPAEAADATWSDVEEEARLRAAAEGAQL
jgi:copper chaperone NosL